MFDRATAPATQVATVDAIIAAKGDLEGAAKTLSVSKDALRARVKRIGLTVDEIVALGAPAKPAKVKGERYERVDGPVTVLDGPSRLVKVAASHPAATAIEIVKELGGKTEATPSGLKLFDEQGRMFAVVATTRIACNFYLDRVGHDVAKSAAPDIGEWSYCWPLQKKGCAVLLGVEKVTKTLVRTLMKLSATHAVDRRRKEFRSAA